ncbi:hypothetical protein [Microbacterium sp. G2-8]|uniref:hypothetical protein n=1 Tax=Microbacterium sp. G2-8 TaxID=2842454 RepID=UPI001C891FE7|nr:hypothetical protein [Microbacterium sp. G2-8]
MTAARGADEVTIPGRTTITERALVSLAVGVVREAAGVSTEAVSVRLADDRRGLRASVEVPVALATGRHATIVERADSVRSAVTDTFGELSGRRIDAVDIRFTRALRPQEGRVR